MRMDLKQFSQHTHEVDSKCGVIDAAVNEFVGNYCTPLDEYMTLVRDMLLDDVNPPSDEELESMVLKLPALLYFTGEGQEYLGIRESLAIIVRENTYNKAYEQADGTVAAREAQAELEAELDKLVEIAYSRAYKMVKSKSVAAYEMLNSVKKVMQRRSDEWELTKVSNGGVR